MKKTESEEETMGVDTHTCKNDAQAMVRELGSWIGGPRVFSALSRRRKGCMNVGEMYTRCTHHCRWNYVHIARYVADHSITSSPPFCKTWRGAHIYTNYAQTVDVEIRFASRDRGYLFPGPPIFIHRIAGKDAHVMDWLHKHASTMHKRLILKISLYRGIRGSSFS